MPDAVPGIHHVTAVASDPQRNVEFYTGVLGLRLVKRTVNFDDEFTYHLYYGDAVGTPGTVLTFFPFAGAGPGRPGRGQTTATAFAVPAGSLDYWRDRLASHGVETDEQPFERFGETVFPFTDHDGQPFELVTVESPIEPWVGGPVPPEHAIRGFAGVTLHTRAPDATAAVLETLGFEHEAETADRRRYRAPGDRATVVDLVIGDGPTGRPGAGTVHHVAFRTEDDESPEAWRERLSDAGLAVTPPE